MKLILRCDAYKTCMRECIAKNKVDMDTIIPGSEEYEFLLDPGSCYHNLHSDGKFREATVERVK